MDLIEFDGPTNFFPSIKRVCDIAEADKNTMNYHLLLILTDGQITDYRETVDELVKGSQLPMSVIIIGIGDADFSSMAPFVNF